MNRFAWLAVAAFACSPKSSDTNVDSDTSDSDTSAIVDTGASDTGTPGPTCDGSFTIDLHTRPLSVGNEPTSWTDSASGAEVSTHRFNGDLETDQVAADVGEKSCIRLKPGVIEIDLLPTGCAASRVEIEARSLCGNGCTKLEIGSKDRMVSSATAVGTEPVTLTRDSTDGSTLVRFSTLDGLICSATFSRHTIPPDQQPVDTSVPF